MIPAMLSVGRLRSAARHAPDLALLQAERLLRSRRGSFEFAGRRYPYHSQLYNTTWRNERTVELPIALGFLEGRQGPVLEFGNVLGHYGHSGHDVVDLYDRDERVHNVDIVDFRPTESYGAVVSVSTLEHVGFDESPDGSQLDEPDKPLRALELLRSWLRPGGELLVTLPVGYNQALDDRLFAGRLSFDELRFMRRVSADNRWVEATSEAVRRAGYGRPFNWANALAVGRSVRPAE